MSAAPLEPGAQGRWFLPHGCTRAGIRMTDTWAGAFIQAKWLNSTHNIVELKCPNPVGGPPHIHI